MQIDCMWRFGVGVYPQCKSCKWCTHVLVKVGVVGAGVYPQCKLCTLVMLMVGGVGGGEDVPPCKWCMYVVMILGDFDEEGCTPSIMGLMLSKLYAYGINYSGC